MRIIHYILLMSVFLLPSKELYSQYDPEVIIDYGVPFYFPISEEYVLKIDSMIQINDSQDSLKHLLLLYSKWLSLDWSKDEELKSKFFVSAGIDLFELIEDRKYLNGFDSEELDAKQLIRQLTFFRYKMSRIISVDLLKNNDKLNAVRYAKMFEDSFSDFIGCNLGFVELRQHERNLYTYLFDNFSEKEMVDYCLKEVVDLSVNCFESESVIMDSYVDSFLVSLRKKYTREKLNRVFRVVKGSLTRVDENGESKFELNMALFKKYFYNLENINLQKVEQPYQFDKTYFATNLLKR